MQRGRSLRRGQVVGEQNRTPTQARGRTAYAANRRYFHDAYLKGEHGWAAQPSPYVLDSLTHLSRPGKRACLLDLGCGEGRHTLAAARLGFWAYGIDYEPLAIHRARLAASQAGLEGRVRFLVADLFALPLTPSSFDVVLDYGCLHHIRKCDWTGYRSAVLSVLKPGGHYLLSVFSTRFHVFGPTPKRHWHVAYGAYRHFFNKRQLLGFLGRRFAVLSLAEERDGERGFWHLLARA